MTQSPKPPFPAPAFSLRRHPTALIDAAATIHEQASIGPFCVIDGPVVLEADVVVHSHVVISGDTRIGEGTEIFPFAVIGTRPQDLKYKGERSQLVIGRHNCIREHVTINPGTEHGGMETRIGDHGLFMVGSHIAHDCQIGDHVIMANNATLAGHVVIDDHAIIGGLSAVHQFVRIGKGAMIGGMSGVEQDVLPWSLVMGERASFRGVNLVGLRRAGTDRECIRQLQQAVHILFDHNRQDDWAARIDEIQAQFSDRDAMMEVLLAFIQPGSQRGFTAPSQAAQTSAPIKANNAR
ncbi:MAG: acyl-ACP--UDP-N-acetylglucosamine O-acyltransferase [Pseudomonadota bacterium]